MLVVTVLISSYFPTETNIAKDIELSLNIKITYLFSVDSENLLRRVQARQRTYNMTEDPTDPNAGTLGGLIVDEINYTRLEASDADLLAP
jgi:hypothetical protein